jgi:hypothetical protein
LVNERSTILAARHMIGTWILQSTEKEMIPAKNTTGAHARDVLANDKVLLLTMKPFAQCTGSLHAVPNS